MSDIIKSLVKLLKKADKLYYEKGEPIMTDEEYDNMVEKLRELDPENKYLQKVGTERTNEMVKLPYPMGTLNKIQNEDEDNVLMRWKKTYKGNYILSDKLDGISCQCYKDKKGEIRLYTRGDYTSGKDITHILKYININVENIENEISIRGELIVTKENFKTIEGYKNGRNMVAGIINSKKINKEILKKIDFVGYAIMNPRYKIEEQLKKIENMRMKVVEWKKVNEISIEILQKYLDNRRNNGEYEIDGIVITDNGQIYEETEIIPRYAMAYKHNINFKESKVINIEWNVSKNKLLKPVIEIEPIELGGVIINKITGHNAKNIIDNKIGIGSIVLITRSNDVIPYIEKVIKPGKLKLPDVKYRWNDNEIEFIVDDDSMDDEILVKQIAHFFKTMKVKHLSEETIKKLIENNYRSVIDIIKADKTKLYDIERLGKKSIDKIYNEIDKSFNDTTIAQLMDAAHLFGNLGEKKLQLIINKYPNILLNKWSKEEMYEKLMSIKGLADISVNDFINGYKDFMNFYKELIKYKKINFNESEITGNKFNEQIIVFSGFRDEKLKQYIIDNGGKINDNVSKNTTLLIVKDINEGTSKIIKANELKINIMTLEDFNKINSSE